MIRIESGIFLNETANIFPGVYNFWKQDGIKISGNDIVIDGMDSLIVGGKEKEKSEDDITKLEEFSYYKNENMYDSSLGYLGIGLHITNANNVTLRNIVCRGFLIGLMIENCTNVIVENCDFSNNYSNFDWGWDNHYDLGGIIVKNSTKCHFENVISRYNWNGIKLINSNENTVKNTDCSYCTNVGLGLWLASNNTFEDSDFSHGLRKYPFEVHARDSSSILIETKSDNNKFFRNNMKYGGDGIFIRSLNGIMSVGNIFIENDTSFANNNAIEAWDEGNIYIRNKANASSYGFWLGNSDNTLLQENEVKYNGHLLKNAPETFGNSGIAIVNGSGTNVVMRDNVVTNNNGHGVVIRYNEEYLSQSLVFDNNVVENNSKEPYFLKNATNIISNEETTIVSKNIYNFFKKDFTYSEEKIQYEVVEKNVTKFEIKLQSIYDEIMVFNQKGEEVEIENIKVEYGVNRITLFVINDNILQAETIVIYGKIDGEKLDVPKPEVTNRNKSYSVKLDRNDITKFYFTFKYECEVIDWTHEINVLDIDLLKEGKIVKTIPYSEKIYEFFVKYNESKYIQMFDLIDINDEIDEIQFVFSNFTEHYVSSELIEIIVSSDSKLLEIDRWNEYDGGIINANKVYAIFEKPSEVMEVYYFADGIVKKDKIIVEKNYIEIEYDNILKIESSAIKVKYCPNEVTFENNVEMKAKFDIGITFVELGLDIEKVAKEIVTVQLLENEEIIVEEKLVTGEIKFQETQFVFKDVMLSSAAAYQLKITSDYKFGRDLRIASEGYGKNNGDYGFLKDGEIDYAKKLWGTNHITLRNNNCTITNFRIKDVVGNSFVTDDYEALYQKFEIPEITKLINMGLKHGVALEDNLLIKAKRVALITDESQLIEAINNEQGKLELLFADEEHVVIEKGTRIVGVLND